MTRCFLLSQHLFEKRNIHVELQRVDHVQHLFFFPATVLGALLIESLLQSVLLEVPRSLIQVRELGYLCIKIDLCKQTVGVVEEILVDDLLLALV